MMKKPFFYAIGLLSAAAGITSCGDDYPIPDYSRPASNTIAFNCRSAWGEELPTIWTEESRIGYFCPQNNSSNLALGVAALSAGESVGLFYTKQPWTRGEHTFYLYMPYNEASATTRLTGSLSAMQLQNGTSTEHIRQNSLAWAAVTARETENPVSVTLRPVFGCLELGVTTEKWQGWSVESIVLTSKSGRVVAGDYAFDMPTAQLAFTGNESSVLILKVSGAVLDEGTFHGYAAAAPTAADTYAVALTLARDGEPSMILEGEIFVGAVAAEKITAATLAVDGFEASQAVDTSIDLSDSDGDGVKVTANCYVAGIAGQTYRFPATVMGNGHVTPAAGGGYAGTGIVEGITPTTLDPASARLLWQTEPGLVADVKLRNGQVYFTLNSGIGGKLTEGNAVIAVFDEAGAILWSWHVWVTADDLDAAVQTYAVHDKYASYPAYASPVMMDRNLGASAAGLWGTLSSNAAIGLMYQWGRKDPFPASDDSAYTSTRFRKTYDADGKALDAPKSATEFSASTWVNVNRGMTAAEMNRYPMSFVYNVPMWTVDLRDDFWGNPYSAVESNTTGHKSIYDPCPPGYRVPHSYAWSGFIDNGADKQKAAYDLWNAELTGTTTAQYQAFIKANAGLVFNYGAGSTAYPGNGMINKADGMLFRVGNYSSCYWSNMPATNANAYRFYFDYGNLNVRDTNARTMGHGVRCMKE